MFRRSQPDTRPRVAITIEGKAVDARDGDTVAAAMLAAGFDHCRTTPVSGERRAPYCMMGVCFECLVTIDGTGNRQGCLIAIEEGMLVETQKGARAVAVDGRAGAGA